MPRNQLLRQQRVQNTAARTVSFKLTGQMTSLPFSVTYTGYLLTLSLVYSCMNGTAPQYLQELIPRYLPVRHLRSSTQSRLRIPSVDQGKFFFGGIRAFSSAAPKLWNSLPITLREHNSKETFKKNMKTYLLSEN